MSSRVTLWRLWSCPVTCSAHARSLVGEPEWDEVVRCRWRRLAMCPRHQSVAWGPCLDTQTTRKPTSSCGACSSDLPSQGFS
jgi:hypothetical protein